MKKVMKALSAIMLMMALCASGCVKDQTNVNVNENVGYDIPQVETSIVQEITETSALGGGVVTSTAGGSIVERGLCWGTESNPTVSGNHVTEGGSGASFTRRIDGLEPNTLYHVRAYAINSVGIGYGADVSFTTLSGNSGSVNAPEGAVRGIYSVSAMDKVYFSKGNLQYQASTGTWRFAEKQYYTVGEGNQNISPVYSGWIDLFGWGTSGYCDKFPYMTSIIGSDYGDGSQNISGTRYDWGVYNRISNGGNQAGMWRTLTTTEWSFMLSTRYTSSGIRYAMAQVNGVNGTILVPDDWIVSVYPLNDANGGSFGSNVISVSQWSILENAGAVFLPAAGYRSGTTINDINSSGYYWSSSYYYNGGGGACYHGFSTHGLLTYDDPRYFGFSVRLVCPAE